MSADEKSFSVRQADVPTNFDPIDPDKKLTFNDENSASVRRPSVIGLKCLRNFFNQAIKTIVPCSLVRAHPRLPILTTPFNNFCSVLISRSAESSKKAKKEKEKKDEKVKKEKDAEKEKDGQENTTPKDTKET